mmetsp:Transcript_75220/g.243505  ORF Transcript_75220/g.243505 Transcript_75220/m.243505 type:complete len:283 (+) Transcript_75220:177-1025(+)
MQAAADKAVAECPSQSTSKGLSECGVLQGYGQCDTATGRCACTMGWTGGSCSDITCCPLWGIIIGCLLILVGIAALVYYRHRRKSMDGAEEHAPKRVVPMDAPAREDAPLPTFHNSTRAAAVVVAVAAAAGVEGAAAAAAAAGVVARAAAELLGPIPRHRARHLPASRSPTRAERRGAGRKPRRRRHLRPPLPCGSRRWAAAAPLPVQTRRNGSRLTVGSSRETWLAASLFSSRSAVPGEEEEQRELQLQRRQSSSAAFRVRACRRRHFRRRLLRFGDGCRT